jgi:spermidine/putrescine-binding protein
MNKKVVILLLALFLLSGCTKKQNQKELNILNWSSYIPDSVIQDFEKETNIKVNYGTYSSNEELLAKVSSAKKGTYDLIVPSDYMVELMSEKGLISKLNKDKIIHFDNIKKQYLNLDYDKGNNYAVPFLAATTVIVYNSKTIKEEITSYNDLLNSKYKNNIVFIDDQRIVIGAALLARGYNMNSTNKKELEKAKEWLLQIKNNIKAFDSDSPKTFLITKETDIGFMWNAEAAMSLKENPNLKVVYPKEGFALSIDNMCIMNQARHEENAYKFINYILRPEVMKKIIDEYPYQNLNKETDKLLDKDYLNNIASNTPASELKRSSLVKNIGSSLFDYDKIWAEIK